MGTNGTKNASVTPDVYIFNVAQNGGTWDGTCTIDKYYTTAIADVSAITTAGSLTGWKTAGNVDAPSSLSAPSGMTTYYAQFGSSSHTVTITTPSNGTLAVEDESDIPVSNGDAVAHGSTLTLTATPDAGYKFGSWTNDAAASVTVNSDVTLGVTFAQKSYTLNATAGAGGSGVTRSDGGNSATVKRYGETVTLTPVASTGYHFTGWAGNGAAYVNGSNVFTVPDGDDNTVYNVQATFQANTYQVSFDAGDGSGAAMANQSFTYGETKALSANTYTASATISYDYNGATGGIGATSETVNATFDSWFDGVENFYADEAEVSNLTTANGVTVELMALWEWGKVTLPSPTKTGYTFNQWVEEMELGFVIIGEGDAEYELSEDIAAIAQWNIVTYHLTYEGLEGASNSSNPATYTIETPTITFANPGTRTGYTFTGWTCGGSPITQIAVGSTGDKTITANWTLDAPNYDLTFQAGANGSVSGTAASAAIVAGTTHSIAENTAISLTATANTFYQFKEWQNTSTHEKVSESNPYKFDLTGTTDLTAVFEIANPLVLIDNENAAYYTAYDALAGMENVNVRINRSISANTWSTICLPFDVDLEEAGNEGYDGKFYKYMGATGDYNGIDLHFTPTGYVDANTPYLFRSDAAVTQLDFANVTLQARQVNDEGTIGNVTFRGTILPQTLNDVEGHTILGLYNNLIYYPNTTSGTYIRAFRGYFIVDGMAGVQPRVRIVVQDNNATPIEVIELGGGETKTPVRKYVEDGVMIIEKNGIRYSVTGQEMK